MNWDRVTDVFLILWGFWAWFEAGRWHEQRRQRRERQARSWWIDVAPRDLSDAHRKTYRDL